MTPAIDYCRQPRIVFHWLSSEVLSLRFRPPSLESSCRSSSIIESLPHQYVPIHLHRKGLQILGRSCKRV
ncbi:hypothetical protein LINPERHAP2_LOCUS35003, partial [Linum perenne]